MIDTEAIEVGDILALYRAGIPHRWRVRGIHFGAIGQESLVEMESITHKPGWTGEWEWHPIIWVPEVLCRQLDKVHPDSCSGHIASPNDPKVCARCGIHIDELRPE